MLLNDIIALDKAHYMNTFGDRIPIVFKNGKGSTLYDQDGKEYTDFLAGIATNSLGYADPGFTKAICDQAQNILHCSNYFYVEQQAELAALLCESTCADRVFFASTGAEANECAIKLARKYFYSRKANRYEIISANNSFHGRTLATLAATGQEAYRKAFAPVMAGFINVDFNDLTAIENAINESTAAVMLELIQGEGGVLEADEDYIRNVRNLCDEKGILLIFDEVQTGMGRTGKLFAHQLYGVEPDIFTSAKALGNGIPISACLCKEAVSAFSPGDHGTTFGGNPFCCTAGLYVLRRMLEKGFLENVEENGAYFKNALAVLASKNPDKISDLRGKGLLLGIELTDCLEAAKVKLAMLEKGFVIGTAGRNTLRFVPPLIITKNEIDSLVSALQDLIEH